MLHKFLSTLHPSWTFYAAVGGVIAGLIISIIFELTIFNHFIWLIIGLLILFICLRFSSRATFCLAILAGFLLGSFRASSQFVGRELLESQLNRSVLLAGQLSEDPATASSGTVLRLQNLQLCRSLDDAQACTPIAGQAYVTISSRYELERSDRVLLQGKLSAGFGTFVAKMTRPIILRVDRAIPGDIFAQIKHWFSGHVRRFIPAPEVDLGLGYLMGMKSGLPEDFSEALQAVGMTHVVVASGAHLAILTGVAKKLFGKISRFAGLLFSLLMIICFVLIVGFTPSMTRAALVASLSLITGYVGRKFTSFRLISFVAMLTLLISPQNFLNLGWQLSFASFFGILILAPHLTKTFYGGKNPPWLASTLITSCATSLVCAPILIYSFGSLSLLSFVANLVILPTLPYAMLLVFLTGATSFLPLLATLIAQPATWLLDLHIWLVNFLSEKTMFILDLPAENPLIFLLYIPVIAFIALPIFAKVASHLSSRGLRLGQAPRSGPSER